MSSHRDRSATPVVAATTIPPLCQCKKTPRSCPATTEAQWEADHPGTPSHEMQHQQQAWHSSHFPTQQVLYAITHLATACPTVPATCQCFPPLVWPISSWCTPFWYTQEFRSHPCPITDRQHRNLQASRRFPGWWREHQTIRYHSTRCPDASHQEWHEDWWPAKYWPWAQVSTIPLSQYQKLLPHKLTESRYPKPGTLIPTAHTWISHDSTPKPFLGHFITEVNHAMLPRSYPPNSMYLRMPLPPRSYSHTVTSEHLGILEFKVPNLVAHDSHIDVLTIVLPALPLVASGRPLNVHLPWTYSLTWTSHITPSPTCSLRKTAKSVHFSDLATISTNGTQCKQTALITSPTTTSPQSLCSPSP